MRISRGLLIQSKSKAKSEMASANCVGLFPKAAQITMLIEAIMKARKSHNPKLHRSFSVKMRLLSPGIGALMSRKVLDCWSNLAA